jgi:hypothetical protein
MARVTMPSTWPMTAGSEGAHVIEARSAVLTRTKTYILVCLLGFVLWKTLDLWRQRAGLGNSPRTVLEELVRMSVCPYVRIQSHDIVLPTTGHCEIRLRCVTQPDTAQAVLLERLGIMLPKRMRLSELELRASTLALKRVHQSQ